MDFFTNRNKMAESKIFGAQREKTVYPPSPSRNCGTRQKPKGNLRKFILFAGLGVLSVGLFWNVAFKKGDVAVALMPSKPVVHVVKKRTDLKDNFHKVSAALTKVNYTDRSSDFPVICGYSQIKKTAFYSFPSNHSYLENLNEHKETNLYHYAKEKNLENVKRFLSEKHEDPAIQFRVKNFNAFIGHLRKIKDPTTKCAAINGYANMCLSYSHEKASYSDVPSNQAPETFRGKSWGNSFEETMRGEPSVCIDYAVFMATSAILGGFDPKDVFILSLSHKDKKTGELSSHAILGIETNKGLYLMQNLSVKEERAAGLPLCLLLEEKTFLYKESDFFYEGSPYKLCLATNGLDHTAAYLPSKKHDPAPAFEQQENDPQDADKEQKTEIMSLAAEQYWANGGLSLEITDPVTARKDFGTELLLGSYAEEERTDNPYHKGPRFRKTTKTLASLP